ncbi:hypothetical protein DPMN_114914 [Dreissena polymorpha]|uniref:Uncharacterized protein n=1 Tax=Dreissena polymorpha TaxID=45954 RepID=A0A9D4KKX7_DREPO|nr:hypothetical protein DPMN_114914 [Dreissena polymorpha]
MAERCPPYRISTTLDYKLRVYQDSQLQWLVLQAQVDCCYFTAFVDCKDMHPVQCSSNKLNY